MAFLTKNVSFQNRILLYIKHKKTETVAATIHKYLLLITQTSIIKAFPAIATITFGIFFKPTITYMNITKSSSYKNPTSWSHLPSPTANTCYCLSESREQHFRGNHQCSHDFILAQGIILSSKGFVTSPLCSATGNITAITRFPQLHCHLQDKKYKIFKIVLK